MELVSHLEPELQETATNGRLPLNLLFFGLLASLTISYQHLIFLVGAKHSVNAGHTKNTVNRPGFESTSLNRRKSARITYGVKRVMKKEKQI